LGFWRAVAAYFTLNYSGTIRSQVNGIPEPKKEDFMPIPTPDFALGYCAMMLDGVGREAEITRKVFAAIPEEKRDYRPDPCARTAWELAWHIANSDTHFLDSIADLKFNMTSPAPDPPKTVAELVDWYGRNIVRGVDRVRALSPEQLLTPIQFFTFNFPAAFYLGFLNNHSVHHRGELATYLRPMGSKVPSIYGGSYDEPMQTAA
jgi:uncharacterized damage-inducible protein DinB